MALGCGILLAGFDQPLPLLVISACVGGLMMFIYSILLLVLNRVLPEEIRPRRYRVVVLGAAVALFGVFSALTVWQQGDRLLDWLR